MQLKATYGKFTEGLYQRHFKIPNDLVIKLSKDGKKRILCTVESNPHFHCAMMSDGKGGFFIMLNKEKEKQYGLVIGEEYTIKLEKDKSKYGMYLPEEFEELLYQDPKGEAVFETLTDGKKRNLIHLVAVPKKSETRLKKAVVILEYLKSVDGKLDFKELNQAFKDYS